MPVSLTIEVADPLTAPLGWAMCAFEVRAAVGGRDFAAPVATFAGTTAGFEASANVLLKAAEMVLRETSVGLRLAAVAWWADAPLTECKPGRERLVSVYDAAAGVWGEWAPESRVQGRPVAASLKRSDFNFGRMRQKSLTFADGSNLKASEGLINRRAAK